VRAVRTLAKTEKAIYGSLEAESQIFGPLSEQDGGAAKAVRGFVGQASVSFT
jgi:hypothetical protein